MAWDIGAYAVGSTLPTPSTPPTATTGWTIGAYAIPLADYYNYFVNMPNGSDSYYVNFPTVSTYYYYTYLIGYTAPLSPTDRPVATTGWAIGAYETDSTLTSTNRPVATTGWTIGAYKV